MEKEEVMLASSASLKVSLEAVRLGNAGLSERRKSLLEKVPVSGNWVMLPKESIGTKDLAFLSAATKHEFALLRGKKEAVLFYGTAQHCNFGEEWVKKLKERKYELVAHSHPDWGPVEASADGRKFLRYIGQKKSLIVSYITGEEKFFGYNIFEDVGRR